MNGTQYDQMETAMAFDLFPSYEDPKTMDIA